MLKYTANYTNSNSNFVIQNLPENMNCDSAYFSIVCILKNILMRGAPTLMSQFLQEKLGSIHKKPDFEEVCPLIAKEKPLWVNTIKGDSINRNYPAMDFFEKIIPEYLPSYGFIQQLILPEAFFDEIVNEPSNTFVAQQVDFYLPQAKLVIEIDGQQHRNDELIRLSDKERDEYLVQYGITVIRINTCDIYNRTENLAMQMNKIEHHLKKFYKELAPYRKCFEDSQFYKNQCINLKATAIIRFQILILSLIECGRLSLSDEEWRFSIVNRDIQDFEQLAISDLFLWLHHLMKLQKLKFVEPKIILNQYTPDNSKFDPDCINIDFSLLQRWTDENSLEGEEQRIYVRTDYFDNRNYFRVSTASIPLKYEIKHYGKDSDDVSLIFFLKNIFGYDSFNSGQLPIIINALEGKDTVGLLPTGAGKSLIYQYVALLKPCITFIVAPIKALMKDQKDNLDKLYITNSNFINSNQKETFRRQAEKNFSAGKYQFTWISPERFQSPGFRKNIVSINKEHLVGLAVIDEVHCLSEWGHDFRTSYLNLAKTIRNYCRDAKVLALTATASMNVLKDILVEFQIDKRNVKTLPSFTRPELTFKVLRNDSNRYKYKVLSDLLNILNEKRNVFDLREDATQAGLIFTRFVNGPYGCCSLAHNLSKEFDIDVNWYSGACPKKNYYYSAKKIEKLCNDGAYKEKKCRLSSCPLIKKLPFKLHCKNGDKCFVQGNKVGRTCYLENCIAIKRHNVKINCEETYCTAKMQIPIMDDDEFNRYKDKAQDSYQNNEISLLVATKAFGMGINKSNIRYTVHYGVPESLEALYQEGGRAGRDHKAAACYVILSEEHMSKEELKALFSMKTSLRDIRILLEKNKYKDSDISDNMYLWMSNANSVDQEVNNIKKILELYQKQANKRVLLINGIDAELNKITAEKSIYKLSLLGIVNDWVIQNWNEYNYKITVYFNEYNDYIVGKNLYSYIRKYDKEFNLKQDMSLRDEAKTEYYQIYNMDIPFIEKAVRILLTWQYENIAYHRRQSIYTVYNQCRENYDKPEALKQYMESYFRFDGMAFNFDYIIEHPSDYKYWFSAFYNDQGDLYNKEGLQDIQAILRRYLESFRFNTGLNFISGMLHLLLDDYDNNDGRIRFEDSLETVRSFEKNKVEEILSKIYILCENLSQKQKQQVSQSLLKEFPQYAVNVYDHMKDEYSLTEVLKQFTSRIKYRTGEML